MPQRVSIVLIRIATGDLEYPLTQQRFDAVTHRALAPLGNLLRQRGTQPQDGVGFRQPDQTPIQGESATIEAHVQRQHRRACKTEAF